MKNREMIEKRMVSMAGLFGMIGSILLAIKDCPALLPHVCRLVPMGDGTVLYDNLFIPLAATACLEAVFASFLHVRAMRWAGVFGVIGYALMFFLILQTAFMGAEEMIVNQAATGEWLRLVDWVALFFVLIAFGELHEFLPRKFAVFDVVGIAGLYAWSGICILSSEFGLSMGFVWVVELVYAGSFFIVFFGLRRHGIEARERRGALWIKMVVCLLAVLNLAIAQRGVAQRRQWVTPSLETVGEEPSAEGALH